MKQCFFNNVRIAECAVLVVFNISEYLRATVDTIFLEFVRCLWMSGVKTEKEAKKIDLGAKVPPYPMPVILVGANVKGKANFLAVAWFTTAGTTPPKVAIALNKAHYTNQGIKENKTFSVCIPSENIVKATDYCGMVSGSKSRQVRGF